VLLVDVSLVDVSLVDVSLVDVSFNRKRFAAAAIQPLQSCFSSLPLVARHQLARGLSLDSTTRELLFGARASQQMQEAQGYLEKLF
jgi:hypothetical protein